MATLSSSDPLSAIRIAAPTFSPTLRRRVASFLGLLLFFVGVAAGAVGVRYFDQKVEPIDETQSLAPTKTSEASVDSVVFTLEKQAAAGIETAEVSSGPLVSRTWRTGRIALNEDRVAHVCPPAEGIVRDVPVTLGQRVEAGEVLAILESRELGLAKLDAFKAKMALAIERDVAARAGTTMANAEELLKLLMQEKSIEEIEKRLADRPIGDWRQQLLGAYTKRNQLKMQLTLQQSASGSVPESAIQRTESEFAAASAAFTSLTDELRFQVKNQVRQADLKLKEAETTYDVAKSKLTLFGLPSESIEQVHPSQADLSLLVLRAPLKGTVVEKHAVRSERVGLQSNLFMIADLSSVWVQADLFEVDLPLVRGRVNQTLTFRSNVAGILNGQATVVYPGDIVDKVSRTLTLTAEEKNADRGLKPGMFVEVGFDTGDPTSVVQAPASAVLRNENKTVVFVRQGETHFRLVPVEIGRSADDRVEILRGLKAGDQVVVRGGFVLKSELLKDQMVGE